MKFLSLIFFLILHPLSSFGADFSRSDRVLYVAGEIHEGDFEKFSKVVSEGEISFVILNSIGGNAIEAMKIASVISDMRLNTIVSDICASSCANYMFLAGSKKIIMQHGVLIWHGSYSKGCEHTIPKFNSENKNDQEILDYKRKLNNQHLENDKFFKKISVKNNITCLSVEVKRIADKVYPDSTGFTLTLNAMKYFGVVDIFDFRNRYVEEEMSKYVAVVGVEMLKEAGYQLD